MREDSESCAPAFVRSCSVTSQEGLAVIALAWLLVFAATFACAGRFGLWRGQHWLGRVIASKGKAEEV